MYKMKTLLIISTAGLVALLCGNSALAVTASIDPSSKTVGVGSTFSVNVLASTEGQESILGWDFSLAFDNTQLAFTGFTVGSDWDAVPSVNLLNPDSLAALAFPDAISGTNVLLATLSFRCLAEGVSMLGLANSTGTNQGFLLGTDASGAISGLVTPVDDIAVSTATITQSGESVPDNDPATLLLLLPLVAWLVAWRTRRHGTV